MSADERIGSGSRAELAIRLALAAGRMALDRFHHAGGVGEAGVAIQEALAAEIAAAFPDDGVVSGEGDVESRPGARYAWIVDAIAGADSFERGIPGFSVSVGILRDGLPFAGAVYDPVARWLFNACAGRGAWLNDRPLHTRAAPLSERSLVALNTPCEAPLPALAEDWLRRYRVRRFGSTALHLCYVALGGLDVVYDDRASLRDIAGAATILLESGGCLSDDDGAPLFPASRAAWRGGAIPILAAHAATHERALEEIRRARVGLAPLVRR